MNATAETIRAVVESAGSDLRRTVQMAVALAVQHGLERDILRGVEAHDTVGSRWLRAALTEKIAGPEEAAALWQEVVAQNGCEIPDVLLHRARTLARRGDISGAAGLIRLALQNSHDFDLYIRAETVARKCHAGFACKRKVKIALLGSSTTALLRTALNLVLLRDALEPDFYEAPYGTYVQELLDPNSALKSFRPDFIFLLLNWRDLGLPSIADNDTDTEKAVHRIKDLWGAALNLPSCQLIQLTFCPPPYDPGHELSSLMTNGRTHAIRRINDELYKAANHRVILIDSERIASTSAGRWEDPLVWSSAKVYPAPALLPRVGEHVVSCIRAELGISRKLLVLDLDNTLWGGVIGEDGLNGIQLGPPSAAGERYQDFQCYLKDLKRRGVLLAIASKNNAEDVAEVFRRHPSAVLQSDDFVSTKVNWEEKASSIRKIASELRLGLDSFVFLDDNPAERSGVRRELPDVIVPEISGDPAESIGALERGLYFQAVRLSDEDRRRSASYLSEAKRADLFGTIGSVDEYLAELAMQIEYGSIDQETSIRVTQLINKTNQFNLTTPRYSHEEVISRIASPNYWCRWYRLKDRFADHGLIAVLIAEIAGKQWSVDTWLMSCRIIGREVESFMFMDLVQSARNSGAEQLTARYIPTAKNGLVAQLLPRLGFAEAAQSNVFVVQVPTVRLPECKFLRETHREMETQTKETSNEANSPLRSSYGQH